MGKILGIIIAVLVVVGLIGVGMYNNLVNLDEAATGAWAQVETVLQRRFDLIPNLVNTVKGYAQHEKGVFEEVARLRSQWSSAQNVEAKVQAATQLEGALSKLMVVVENYPTLKADKTFTALMDELAGTENRIAVERQRYNAAVRDYNAAIRRFPNSLVAGVAGLKRRTAYFEAVQGAQTAPKVEF